MTATGNIVRFLLGAALVAALSLTVILAADLGRDGDGDLAGAPTLTPRVLPAAAEPSPEASPTLSTTPITQPFELPILMYHHVAPALPADEFEARLTVTTGDLEAQLSYLQCAGYTGITLARLFDAIDGRAALPTNPVILSFDDGYADAFSDAFPLLQRHGVPGSFAIVTGFIGSGDLYMTWDQVRALAGSGMEIMSHTISHVDLGTSDDETVRDQLATSKATLEQQTGRAVPFFVYPSGEPFRSGSEERQQQVVALLREAGYRGALLAGPNSVTQDPATPFALSRVRVSGGEDVYTFAGSIGGPSPDSLSC